MTILDGIYLEDNPPAIAQYRRGRRADVKPVIVFHTAESGRWSNALGVARFIEQRDEHGSYHLVGDEENIVQLVDFNDEAFGDGTGSNRWAIHISLAMNAAEWTTLNGTTRGANLIRTAGQMVAIADHWLKNRGLTLKLNGPISKRESDDPRASGLTSHALRDPTRRTDPGQHFPWQDVIAEARFWVANFDDLNYRPPTTGGTVPQPNPYVRELQITLQERGLASSNADSYLDGIMGPVTLGDTLGALDAQGDPGDRAKAIAFDTWADAQRAIAAARTTIDDNQLVINNMTNTIIQEGTPNP